MDVYSFGVLMCQMCIRELPDRERRSQQVEMVTDYVIQDLIKECLERDPKDRPGIERIVNELGKGMPHLYQ